MNKHKRKKNQPNGDKMTENDFRKPLFKVCVMFLFWLMSHLPTRRGRGLWHTATHHQDISASLLWNSVIILFFFYIKSGFSDHLPIKRVPQGRILSESIHIYGHWLMSFCFVFWQQRLYCGQHQAPEFSFTIQSYSAHIWIIYPQCACEEAAEWCLLSLWRSSAALLMRRAPSKVNVHLSPLSACCCFISWMCLRRLQCFYHCQREVQRAWSQLSMFSDHIKKRCVGSHLLHKVKTSHLH